MDIGGSGLKSYIEKYNPDYDPEWPMFRGAMGEGRAGVIRVDPGDHVREPVSAESRAYCDYFDASEAWSFVPDRRRSVMLSNSPHTANSYGNVFAVVPKAGARLAVLKYDDIWHHAQFPRLGTYLGMTQIIDLFKMLINRYMSDTAPYGEHNSNYNDYSVRDRAGFVEWLKTANPRKPIPGTGDGTWMEILDYVTDPAHTVEVVGVSEAPRSERFAPDPRSVASWTSPISMYKTSGVEMWTDSECLVVKWSEYVEAFPDLYLSKD